jgi:hypothetical protein
MQGHHGIAGLIDWFSFCLVNGLCLGASWYYWEYAESALELLLEMAPIARNLHRNIHLCCLKNRS